MSASTMTPEQGRELWLHGRKNFVGGSQAFELLNIPHYGKGCARALGYDKSNTPPDYPLEDLDANLAERGTELEEVVAAKYERETGRKLRNPPRDEHGFPKVRRHPSIPGIGVHTDRHILADGKTAKTTGDLEIKTHGSWPYKRFLREGVTSAHLAQIQHSLAVTGHKWGSLAILCPDLWELKHFDVQRDEELIRIILAEGEKFWNLIEQNKLPEPLPDPEDQRCKVCSWRLTCRGSAMDEDEYARVMEMKAGKEPLIPIEDPEVAQMIADYDLLNGESKDIDSKLDIIKERINEKLGRYGAFLVHDYKFYWKPGSHSGLDVKRLLAEKPEVHAAYYVTGKPTRPSLRIYSMK